MNAPALITVHPIARPQYMNLPVTLETFERWFIANYYAMRRYWLELQECTGAQETAGEFLAWAQCQYDIAKRSPTSAATVHKPLSQDKNEAPTVDAGTAGVDIRISQYRQSIYAYERLIEKLYDLARADRFDELHDLVRAKYLEIHGEPRT